MRLSLPAQSQEWVGEGKYRPSILAIKSEFIDFRRDHRVMTGEPTPGQDDVMLIRPLTTVSSVAVTDLIPL